MTDDVHSILLGGVEITGGTGPVSFSGVTGWGMLPDARGGLDSIPGGHGSYARVEVFRESRAVTVVGLLEADSREALEAEQQRLTSLWERADLLTVFDKTGALSSEVEVQRVEFDDRGGWALDCPFVIDMLAPDPVRYRDAVTLGPVGLPSHEGGLVLPSAFPWNFGNEIRSVLRVVNDGSVPVLPVVRVRGSAASLVVSAGPQRLEFGAFEGLLEFDSEGRRAFLDGADVTRLLVRRGWPVVGTGVAEDFSFEAVSPSSDFLFSVEYRIGVW